MFHSGAMRTGAFSVLVAVLAFVQGLHNATLVSCDGPPPEAWRRSCAYWGLGVALVSDLVGIGLVVRGGSRLLFFALLLGVLSLGASFVGFLLPIFAAGMC
ncbi:MAG: hypothetical protein ABI551_05285 [Polyangiaceae bacterium]